MKKYTKISILMIAIFVVIFSGFNFIISNMKISSKGNMYKVEINRIENVIRAYEKKYHICPVGMSEINKYEKYNYQYITSVDCINDSINGGKLSQQEISKLCDDSDNHYVLYKSEMGLYKIGYILADSYVDFKVKVAFNIFMIIFIIVLSFFLLYIRRNIIKPFTDLSGLPYELSKGKLSIPLKENKNKYFGHFLWGMDMLREKLEEDKQKELELIKEKKLLLISLSHDIKTPLSAIKLYAKALDRNLYDNEEKKHQVSINIGKNVDEIEGYISEIVSASNEDFLQFDVHNEEVYVKPAIDSIKDYYAEKLELAQIKFDINFEDNCLIKGDGNRVVEVMQNIIENAIKYGDGNFITINTKREDEEYIIELTNSGCTLTEKELPHLFDSFFRGTNVQNKPGSGLGLYICRKLMHLMDGEILAEMKNVSGVECMCLKLVFRLA